MTLVTTQITPQTMAGSQLSDELKNRPTVETVQKTNSCLKQFLNVIRSPILPKNVPFYMGGTVVASTLGGIAITIGLKSFIIGSMVIGLGLSPIGWIAGGGILLLFALCLLVRMVCGKNEEILESFVSKDSGTTPESALTNDTSSSSEEICKFFVNQDSSRLKSALKKTAPSSPEETVAFFVNKDSGPPKSALTHNASSASLVGSGTKKTVTWTPETWVQEVIAPGTPYNRVHKLSDGALTEKLRQEGVRNLILKINGTRVIDIVKYLETLEISPEEKLFIQRWSHQDALEPIINIHHQNAHKLLNKQCGSSKAIITQPAPYQAVARAEININTTDHTIVATIKNRFGDKQQKLYLEDHAYQDVLRLDYSNLSAPTYGIQRTTIPATFADWGKNPDQSLTTLKRKAAQQAAEEKRALLET